MGDKADATTDELVGMAEVINSRLAEILPHQRVRVWRAAVGDYCRDCGRGIGKVGICWCKWNREDGGDE